MNDFEPEALRSALRYLDEKKALIKPKEKKKNKPLDEFIELCKRAIGLFKGS